MTGGAMERVFVGRNVVEAELCVAFLRSEGVAAALEDPMASAALGGILEHFSGGGGPGVLVPAAEAARARELVAAFETGGEARPGDGGTGA